mgnify:CR=1 FL=1
MVEPDIIQGKNPEASLQAAVSSEVHSILAQAEVEYIFLENFGLDIALFIKNGTREYYRFIELKTFVGSRQGGVGFGNRKGEGCQIDILIQPTEKLLLLNTCVIWILGFGTIDKGNPRFAVFNSVEAKQAAMGGVRRGKQNNLRIRDFQNRLHTWSEVLRRLQDFLL